MEKEKERRTAQNILVTLHNFRERMYSRRSTQFKDYTKGRLIEEDKLRQQFENRRRETPDNDYHVELSDGTLLILRCISSRPDIYLLIWFH